MVAVCVALLFLDGEGERLLGRAEETLRAIRRYELRWRETDAAGRKSGGHAWMALGEGARIEWRRQEGEQWVVWSGGQTTIYDVGRREYIRRAEGESALGAFPDTPASRLWRLRGDLQDIRVERGAELRRGGRTVLGRRTVKCTRLVLRSVEPGEQATVEVWVEEQSLLVWRIVTREGARRTQLDLEWIGVDQEWEAGRFEFRPPKGARLVRQFTGRPGPTGDADLPGGRPEGAPRP
jgi:outer membrane lipoprotein-sorting protein